MVYHKKFHSMIRYREINIKSPEIFRIFISGCSAAGKTFFAKRLIQSNFIQSKRIYYFHPDFHEHNPVDWDAIYQPGLPTLDDLLEIPPYSCLVLDDLYHECKDAKVIDYLFRVLSTKRKLHLIIMTQRYFSNGVYSLNIRNSCNLHVLMRNADEHANYRAARTMNLDKEFKLAENLTSSELYPYYVFDKTNYARVSGLQLYIDIFSKHLKVVMKTGLYYLINQSDFNHNFTKIDNQLAKHEPQKSSVETTRNKTKNSTNEIKSKPAVKSEFVNYRQQRHQIRRRVKQALWRYKKRAVFQRENQCIFTE